MGHAQPKRPFVASDYLAWELEQPDKHQFFHGEIFAMAGASRRHATVCGNLLVALDQALEGTPCRVYMADIQLQAHADEAYFYPDVMVTCDREDHRAERIMRSPCVLIEVLSPSTEAFDRGAKAATYRRIPSLRELVLVDPDRLKIELFRRANDGRQYRFSLNAF